MELNDLPDDEMLLVLALLQPADLLQCRVVCRRWRALALHPAVWRNQCFEWESLKARATARAILRWAPCLGRLALDEWVLVHNQTPASDIGQLLSTSCNVRHLECYGSPSCAHLFMQIIERLAQCGKLRSLEIIFCALGDAWEHELSPLLQLVIRTEGLQSLHIYIGDNSANQPVFAPLPPQFAATVPSSLRRLHYEYELSGILDPYLELLLKQHAATLEVVGVWTVDPRAGALLSMMPRLRKLECLLQEDMTALVLPPSLRAVDLDLCVELETTAPARVPGLGAFLHAAVAQLEDLVLRCGRGSWAHDPEVVGLVRCLGGAGPTSSAFRSLAFKSGSGDATLVLSPLASVLQRLPRLARLDIDCVPTAAFLDALDGTVLPELVVLSVCLTSLKACEHTWAHSAEVKTVMRKYPRLHIVVQSVQYTESCRCKYCNMACHDVPPKRPCLIYSHRQGSACEVSHKVVGTKVCAEVFVSLI